MTDTPAEDRSERENRLMREGRKRFIREFQKQHGQLQQWLAEWTAGADADKARRIYRTVHTLKGSAPMFGFMEIGAIAEQLVRIWEWAHEAADTSAEQSLHSQISDCAEASHPLLHALELELEIYGHVLETDEHQIQLQQSFTPAPGERLLVIDDDEVLRSYLVRRLKLDGYEVDEAADVSAAQQLLREHTYHLITLDLTLHSSNGYELFAFLKEDPTFKWIPLIVLSGRSDVKDKVRSFYLGADDYVTKPFQYEELSARIYSSLKRTRIFEQLAFRDPLTGAFNRRFFDHQIQVELGRVQRYPAPISMVFIDIDRFKKINDSYGHHIGDLVLQGLAHLLQNNLRTTDLLARFGGEEFVIVLPDTAGADAKQLIESILDQTRQGPVAQNEGQSFHITFSAGVSEWHAGIAVGEWIRRSDAAMYEAKQQGRNRVVHNTGISSAQATPGQNADIRKKVLIADDDRILRDILIAKLKHLPIDFTEAADGEEAYRILMQQPVGLCILDSVMPKLDGYGLLARMHEQSVRPAAKILMLSGVGREDMSRGLQLGVNAFMHKPFSMVELELKVKELLDL